MKRLLTIILVLCLIPTVSLADKYGVQDFHKKMDFVLNQFGGFLLNMQESAPLPYPNPLYPDIVNRGYTIEEGNEGNENYIIVSYNPVPGVFMKYYARAYESDQDEYIYPLVLSMESNESNIFDNTEDEYEFELMTPGEKLGYGGYAKLLMALFVYSSLMENSYTYYDNDPILQMDQGIDIFSPIALMMFLDDLDRYVQNVYEEPFANGTYKYSEYITISLQVKTAPDPDGPSVFLPEGIDRCYILE